MWRRCGQIIDLLTYIIFIFFIVVTWAQRLLESGASSIWFRLVMSVVQSDLALVATWWWIPSLMQSFEVKP